MHRRTASRTALLALTLLIGTAACGTDDDAPTATDETARDESTTTAAGGGAGHPTAPDDAEEVDVAVVRLAVADPETGEVALIDLGAEGRTTTLELGAPATGATTTADGRFVVLRHEDAVTVVDGGAWAEGHGDHDHHFATEPTVVGEVSGDHPSHLISEDGHLALFFDGTGEAVVLDEAALASGEIAEVARVAADAPHHGFALPIDDGFAITQPGGAPEGELPEQVALVDRAGEPVDEFPCAATHGEAAIEDGVAAACADGVLLVRDGEATTVPYPEVDDVDPDGDPAPRVWSFQHNDDGEVLVGVLGTRHLVRVDIAAGTASAVDIGAPVAGRGLALLDDGSTAAVLSTDGLLRLVDTATGDVTGEVEVLAPFVEDEDDIADRHLVVHGDRAWVTDPSTRAATEIALGDEPSVTRTIDLPVVPGAVALAG
jgi:hypothetical protein